MLRAESDFERYHFTGIASSHKECNMIMKKQTYMTALEAYHVSYLPPTSNSNDFPCSPCPCPIIVPIPKSPCYAVPPMMKPCPRLRMRYPSQVCKVWCPYNTSNKNCPRLTAAGSLDCQKDALHADSSAKWISRYPAWYEDIPIFP